MKQQRILLKMFQMRTRLQDSSTNWKRLMGQLEENDENIWKIREK